MNSISLYGRYLAVSIRAQMQYRMSFLMAATGSFVATIIEVTALWALFDRFGDLPNWNLPEVCFLYGVVNISFAITTCMTAGFDEFGSQYIRTGNFDRLLLRRSSVCLGGEPGTDRLEYPECSVPDLYPGQWRCVFPRPVDLSSHPRHLDG